MNFTQSVESIVDEYMQDASVLLAMDCLDRSYCWSTGRNAGVIFVRNSAKSVAIMQEWAVAPNPGGLCAEEFHLDHYDQDCLNKIIALPLRE